MALPLYDVGRGEAEALPVLTADARALLLQVASQFRQRVRKRSRQVAGALLITRRPCASMRGRVALPRPAHGPARISPRAVNEAVIDLGLVRKRHVEGSDKMPLKPMRQARASSSSLLSTVCPSGVPDRGLSDGQVQQDGRDSERGDPTWDLPVCNGSLARVVHARVRGLRIAVVTRRSAVAGHEGERGHSRSGQHPEASASAGLRG
jgi:hypothetical protein